MKEIDTYQDLVDALVLGMTKEQRSQPIQIANSPSDGSPVALSPAIAIGTVGEFEFEGARSVVDNKYHADEVVLLIDSNPFGEKGEVAWQMVSEGPENRSFTRMIPIYGKGGPTKLEDQLPPEPAAGEVPVHIAATVNYRGRTVDD